MISVVQTMALKIILSCLSWIHMCVCPPPQAPNGGGAESCPLRGSPTRRYLNDGGRVINADAVGSDLKMICCLLWAISRSMASSMAGSDPADLWTVQQENLLNKLETSIKKNKQKRE